MADYGGFNVASPQEMLARVQAQRDQFRQSGDPAVRRQATIDNALDALFGNPQVTAARKITQALNRAQTTVQPQAGEDQLDSELRRLQSMRNAVADIDPSVAAQINQQMLKLGAEKLERQKLMADMTRADQKHQLDVAQAAREEEMHPFKLAEEQQKLMDKQASAVNYVNQKTGEIVSIPEIDSIQARALEKAGWVRTGLNIQVDDPEKVGGLTKAATTDLQKALNESQTFLDQLGNTMQKFDPSFLTLPTQILNDIKSKGERLGLAPDASAKRTQYYEFRANAVDALNQYINKITGAAMGVQEEVRIRRAFPDPERDSATEFLSKMRATVKTTMQVQRRAQQMLAAGAAPRTRDGWEAINLPEVTDAEVNQFMLNQFGVPSGNQPKAQPQAGSRTRPRIISVE